MRDITVDYIIHSFYNYNPSKMATKQRMLHHVSFHFGKSRVLFSVPGTTYVRSIPLITKANTPLQNTPRTETDTFDRTANA
jgi:hypothetical protein